jgi:ABC-type polysaccharide/polyol phosphate transport system, ATPase component
MSNFAVQVENLSKRFRIGLKEKLPDSLSKAALSWITSPVSNFKTLRKLSSFYDSENGDDVIWALKDISFDVKHGEVIGFIGRNGAGKSTLLKVISRITKPTTGRAVLEGRVASLLEVGTGFHNDLTGRENIYLNATMLGMSKREVDRKFDEIVHFSGVEKFIDTPFKRYSSGMKVRLGFSVAAHLEAEILLIDEVLSVGDLVFQQKCIGRMQQIASEGRTVLFVSHDLAAVERLCSKSILLVNGKIEANDESHDVISKYIGMETLPNLEWLRQDPIPDHAYLRRITMIDYDGTKTGTVTSASSVGLEIECVVPQHHPNMKVVVVLRDANETPIFFSFPIDSDISYPEEPGIYLYRIFFPEKFFMPQRYLVTVAVYVNRIWSDSVARALSFDVQPAASLATMEGKARQGIVQVRCRWDCSYSPDAE